MRPTTSSPQWKPARSCRPAAVLSPTCLLPHAGARVHAAASSHGGNARGLTAGVLRRKLTDTPFPFPWVQAVNIALLLFTFAAPIAVVGFIQNPIVSTILTFMAVATHVMLNEVASDIEDPFHYDPNELPLPQARHFAWVP